MNALEQLRQAGIKATVEEGNRLFLEPKSLVTEEVLKLAAQNRTQILADLAEEEVHANYTARSRP
jgi:hypothetical protein